MLRGAYQDAFCQRCRVKNSGYCCPPSSVPSRNGSPTELLFGGYVATACKHPRHMELVIALVEIEEKLDAELEALYKEYFFMDADEREV
jgi:hypothetical protein